MGSLEDIVVAALRDGADLVRMVRDERTRVYARIEGTLRHRLTARPGPPPPWWDEASALAGRDWAVPMSLAGAYARVAVAAGTVHDATVVEFRAELAPAEAARRLEARRSADERAAAIRAAIAAEHARQEAERARPVDPARLARLEAAMEGTRRAVVPLQVGEAGPGPLSSFVGGLPDWPSGRPWPATADGVPLAFLAQVDLAALPPLPSMPRAGLLQFFYLPDEACGTLVHDGLAVVWHADASFDTAPQANLPPPPARGALNDHARRLALTWEGAASQRRPFDEGFEREHPEFAGWCGPEVGLVGDDAEGHAVGGWPVSCQELPYREDTQVLLRLVSDDLMSWGDVGDYHVLIARADLESGSFGAAWSFFNSH